MARVRDADGLYLIAEGAAVATRYEDPEAAAHRTAVAARILLRGNGPKAPAPAASGPGDRR